jgi:hypothetical protein
VFADPFADEVQERRPALVVLDDGAGEAAVTEVRDRLVRVAGEHGVRVERIGSEAGGDVARYAAMLSTGMYTAAYLQIGTSRTEGARP